MPHLIVGRFAIPLLIALPLILAGCGKKGPLYLPQGRDAVILAGAPASTPSESVIESI